jgi:hypothetical protein
MVLKSQGPFLLKTDIAAVPERRAEFRQLAIITEPTELAGIAVSFGSYTVLLPERGDLGFYERLAAIPHDERAYSGKEWPWPRRATYALDGDSNPARD